MDDSSASLSELLDIMRRLRDPLAGCAWDRQQDFHSIAPYTVEEAYEVADAIERNDLDDLRDELGDLLFQVVFHAQMASESGAFAFEDVARGIVDKMIRRHPHVFGDRVYDTEDALKAGWESIKADERRMKIAAPPTRGLAGGLAGGTAPAHSEDPQPVDSPAQPVGRPSALDGIARNLPALKRADKVQKRAARVGFDWPGAMPVLAKIEEEMAEVQAALSAGDAAAVQDEIGDLLFSVVNLARHCQVDAEQAMHQACRKFEKRFRQVEQLASAEPESLQQMTLAQLDALWDQAKKSIDSGTASELSADQA